MKELLKFIPILKPVIWGGRRLAAYKDIADGGKPIGESWEISPIEGMESVVSEGTFKGMPISELLTRYADDILGARLKSIFGTRFPLLIKFLDTAESLSIQVHPDDETALRRHGSPGKSEMWYSIAPEDNSYLYAGFTRKLDSDEFLHLLKENRIEDVLQKYSTRPGDTLFLPAGRIHSLGAGNLVFEVQQASDITYRVYDYDRCDSDGKKRELHIEEGIDVLDFGNCERSFIANKQAIAGKSQNLLQCRYFTADIMGVEGKETINLAERDSFTSLTAIAGDMTVIGPAGSTHLRRGETVLIPAAVDAVSIEGTGTVISVYID